MAHGRCAAGLESLALLHGHGFALALNTARSAAEVKEYCTAYGCAGAVAEYGSYLLDLLTVADEPRSTRLLRALFHPEAFSVFGRRG